MKFPTHLKRILYIALPAGLLYFFGGILEAELLGTHYIQWLWGALIILASLWFTGRFNALPSADRLLLAVSGSWVGLGVWHYELAHHADTLFSGATFQLHVLVMFFLFLVLVPLLLWRRRQVAAYSRQLFEMAARPVSGQEEGFTTRPYPAGTADYTRNEIIAFAKFMDRQLVTRSQIEKDGVTMAFSASENILADSQPGQTSTIVFDNSGHISVQIAEADYREYREQLTFDQLCAALAGVFKSFLGAFQAGEQDRILTALRGSEQPFYRYMITGAVILGLVVFLLLGLSYLLFA